MTSSGPPKSVIDYYKAKASGILSPALTSQYRCRFYPSSISGNNSLKEFLEQGESLFPGSNYFLNQDVIELSCSEASLPGSSLMTNEIIDDHTGVTERHAYRRQYDDRIDFTFYVDKNYKIINFFERWISYCVGENLQPVLDDPNYFYRVNFPKDYQTDALYIAKFEKDFDTFLEYQFIGAYPISIASMPVSYDSSQLLKCTVSFTYKRYIRRGERIEKSQKPTALLSADIKNDVDRAILEYQGNSAIPPGPFFSEEYTDGNSIGIRNPAFRQ